MKKKAGSHRRRDERDTMRPAYDFAAAVRGVTAKRYAQGANIAVIAPEVLDVFPDGATVKSGSTYAGASTSATTSARNEADR